MTLDAGTGGPTAPEFSIRRLVLVVTGAPAAHSVPQWVNWARMCYPELEVRILVTRSALRFVTLTTMRLRTRSSVHIDAWDDVDTSIHVELAQWAEAFLVYPATTGYLARFANGLTDTPSLLALQSTEAVIALAPSLPPGGLAGGAFRRNWAALASQRNVVLVPPEPGISLHSGEMDGHVPPPLSTVLARLEERRNGFDASRQRPADEASEDSERDRRSLRTGLLSTEISSLGDGHVEWVRSPGDGTPRFAPLPRRLAERLAEATPGPTRWAVGTGDRETRTYDAPATVAVAGELLRAGPSPDLVPIFHSLGERLAELHDEKASGPLVTGLDRSSRGLGRLLAWLGGRSTDPTTAVAEGRLRDELGESLFSALRESAEELSEASTTIVHGAASLGSLIAGPRSREARMLIGEDVCLGDPVLDLAWLAGELVELRWVRGDDDATWQDLLDALFAGYGSDLGSRWGRLTALRVALHMHDYTAYVSGDPARTARYPGFIRFLAEQG
ncbi:MAG TPA: hypothetical protein H9800_10985 [Candidatus Microbacterium stercoravium]|uniref:Flavoprotein n=1 Tax=Candidatus Microbacterium stercoravium TaxID=2838697 RepID=A0A9D2KHV4_9MICO|nr:hypothetical protein [Candidatus Microbacterium stercoravium]